MILINKHSMMMPIKAMILINKHSMKMTIKAMKSYKQATLFQASPLSGSICTARVNASNALSVSRACIYKHIIDIKYVVLAMKVVLSN